MTEFDCQRCGIHVVRFIEPHPSIVYCLECTYLEKMTNEDHKQRLSKLLGREDVRKKKKTAFAEIIPLAP